MGSQWQVINFHKDIGSSAVSSLSYRNKKVVVGNSLAPHISLLMPPTGSNGFEDCILHLHGLKKTAVKADRLGNLWLPIWFKHKISHTL